MTDLSLRRLARLLDELRREVRDLQLAPRAAYTSVPVEQDDGTVLEVSVPEMVTTAIDAGATAEQAVEQAAQATAYAAALDEALTQARRSLDEATTELDTRLSEARTDLDAAKADLAGVAEEVADAAMTASAAQADVDAVPRIVHATTAPDAETAPMGSTWFQHAETLAGAVIGQWTQTGDGIAAQWTPVQLASDVIAGLDVGKLTVGSAQLVEAVAQRIAAAVGAFLKLDVGQLTASDAAIAEAVIEKLWVGLFMARKIAAEEIAAGAIDGMTITGAVLQTNKDPAPSGPTPGGSNGFRIFGSNQLRAWKSWDDFIEEMWIDDVDLYFRYRAPGTDLQCHVNGYGLSAYDNRRQGVGTSYEADRLVAQVPYLFWGEEFTFDGAVRLAATADASPTSTGHAFQIGPDDGSNLRIDQNEILSLANGAVSPLHLNPDGGVVYVGGTIGAAAYIAQMRAASNSDRVVPNKAYVDGPDVDATAPTVSSVASGWTVTASCVRRGGWAMLTIQPVPTAAWQTAGAGNVTDLALCTVQAGFRPAATAYLSGNQNALLGGSLDTSGVVTLSATAGGLTAGQTTARIQFVYPLA